MILHKIGFLLLLSDILGIRIDYILSLISDGDFKVSAIIKNICGEERTLGDYLSELLPDLGLKPINENLYGIVLYEFVKIVVENALGAEYKDLYIEELLEDIEIGHFVEPFMGLTLTASGWKNESDNLQVLFYMI